MILFVCLACEKDTEDTLSFQSDSSLEKFKLELSEKYSLELDSATSFYNNSIQYTEKEGKQYISLFNELKRRKGKYGMVTACVGGGQGVAGVFEMLN